LRILTSPLSWCKIGYRKEAFLMADFL